MLLDNSFDSHFKFVVAMESMNRIRMAHILTGGVRADGMIV
ncbi:hypothetical protein UF75_5186 [Desulfosporosinus sp. I2]|nr:hypothetical protein UF75_5186 [Desulfosporosinus sp. I2]